VRLNWKFLPAVLFLVCACHHDSDKANSENQQEVTVIEMPDISKEIYFPNKIWDVITGADFSKSVHSATTMIFSEVEVEMDEKTEGVLTKPHLRLKFPKGGGEVDLSKYVKGERGTFRLKFNFDGMPEGEDLNVFFVSRGKKRKLDDEVYGSGCGVFYDIKKDLVSRNSGEGLMLNVTHYRHVSALGGHFVFSYKKNKQTYVTEVSFTDSLRPTLFCDERQHEAVPKSL
jgi:hypothetical protein